MCGQTLAARLFRSPEENMRGLAISILVVGFAVSGCDRGSTASSRPGSENGQFDNALATGGGDRAAAKPSSPLELAVARTEVREFTIPAGTELPVVLDTAVGSDTSTVEQAVHAHLSRAVMVDGEPVLPVGSSVSGVVTEAVRSGKVKGRAHIAVRFNGVTPAGDAERYRIETAAIGRTAPATKKADAVKIGAPAAGGAIIGAIVGGGKGAAIGATAGGGAGTAVVLSTRGKEIHLPAGSALRVRLTEPVTVRLARS
jgi:hypothetical protein